MLWPTLGPVKPIHGWRPPGISLLSCFYCYLFRNVLHLCLSEFHHWHASLWGTDYLGKGGLFLPWWLTSWLYPSCLLLISFKKSSGFMAFQWTSSHHGYQFTSHSLKLFFSIGNVSVSSAYCPQFKVQMEHTNLSLKGLLHCFSSPTGKANGSLFPVGRVCLK